MMLMVLMPSVMGYDDACLSDLVAMMMMPTFMLVSFDRIGFGQGGSQLAVDEEGKEDIIMWMDHRQFTVIVNIMVIVKIISVAVVIS